ncbi:MAG: hypothetical protein JW773_13575, partial [Desulfuromonadales bacterium]|nr:hypothetical protein [Desulfuromonadales bacterium]
MLFQFFPFCLINEESYHAWAIFKLHLRTVDIGLEDQSSFLQERNIRGKAVVARCFGNELPRRKQRGIRKILTGRHGAKFHNLPD